MVEGTRERICNWHRCDKSSSHNPQVRILLPPQHFRDSDKRSDEIEISAPRNGRARSGDHRTNT